jgi:hypothetical protein
VGQEEKVPRRRAQKYGGFHLLDLALASKRLGHTKPHRKAGGANDFHFPEASGSALKDTERVSTRGFLFDFSPPANQSQNVDLV